MPDIRELMSRPNIVKERWLPPEMAIWRVINFERFGKGHLTLACYSALPSLLTPELVNLIRVNFLDEKTPWLAEMDLLLSDLCTPMGDGIYEVEPRVREVLLVELKHIRSWDEILRLAQFVYIYANSKKGKLPSYVQLLYHQIASAYLQPDVMMQEARNFLLQSLQEGKDHLAAISAQLQIIDTLELLRGPLEQSALQPEVDELYRSTRILAYYRYGNDHRLSKDLQIQADNETDISINSASLFRSVLDWVIEVETPRDEAIPILEDNETSAKSLELGQTSSTLDKNNTSIPTTLSNLSEALDTPPEVFFAYAPADEKWRERIEVHLGIFKRNGLIKGWHTHKTLIGGDWETELDAHLKNAHIILLLISSDFINSDECYSSQLQQAIERQKAGTTWIIPILVHPTVGWQDTPIGHLQVLPRDGKPLSLHRSKEATIADIAKEIRQYIEALRQKQQTTSPSSTFTTEIEPIWNIPFRQNRFFTGREDILSQIHTQLQHNKTTALSQPIAMSGLGGIGKTQTAVEYAYRYRDDYQVVCWVKSSTPEELAEDFASIATLLHLPEQQAQEQKRIIAVVKRWFETHTHWLLIFDNANDLPILYDYLSEDYKGHVLITTRAYATSDIATSIEMKTMGNEEGARLLLRRAGVIKQDTSLEHVKKADLEAAYAIIGELGGLPLALDQAGAYLEETGETLANYLPLYRQERATLLKRRGGLYPDHAPVATTWELALQNIELDDPAAIELIRLYAFLAPDAIPEDMFNSNTAQFLPNTLKPLATKQTRFNEAIALLLKYSLIQRANKTVTIHRLVQAVVKDAMGKTQQAQWAERVVRMLAHVFPFNEAGPWPRSQRYIAHALIAVEYINQWHLTMPEAGGLLTTLGTYFLNRGQYSETEPLFQYALSIREKYLGLDHPETAISLNNLANLYTNQGKFELAEPLLQRALSIREQHLGSDHPETAYSLNDLANLYQKRGKFEVAEPLYQRALSIREQRLGSDHPETAATLNNLALLYQEQGKYELAEPLLQRALSIREQRLGPDHPETATTLNNLATLHQEQGKYELAELFYQRALSIQEMSLGLDHPFTRKTAKDYTSFLRVIGRTSEASALVFRFLSSS